MQFQKEPHKMDTESPCIGVCNVGPDGICIGCYRTHNEISKWVSYSEEEKSHIIEIVEDRKIKAYMN